MTRTGRPYRIGRNLVTQEEFDAEVFRLYRAGSRSNGRPLKLREVADAMHRGRTQIWESLRRSRLRNPEGALEAKEEREYHRETADEFLNEPSVSAFREDLRARKVKSWRTIINGLRRVCDELQIYPGQLDLEWGRKWLVVKADVPLNKLRNHKTFVRSFLKARGYSDYELGQAGLDAKHYGVGVWRHVRLTEGQISKIRRELRARASPEAQFAFNFGLETCRPTEIIWSLKRDQLYELRSKGRKTLYCANVFRKKTERAGGPYRTAYITRKTYELGRSLGARTKGGQVMAGKGPRRVAPELRSAYRKAGVEVAYFYEHPVHALRHSGAQRLLEETGFNRAVVAELGGWESEKTLEDHYGGVPVDLIRGIIGKLL